MRTDVVVDVLATNVEKCSGKVTVRHHQPIIQTPQCCGKSIRDTRKTSARRTVRLEHHEWLADLLGVLGDVQVLPSDAHPSGVSEVHGKHVLRLTDCST